jgi:predicted nucleic acid-binding protein
VSERTASRPAFVLDSFAIMSLLEEEPGADQVEALLQRARTGRAEVWLCVVNYGEALYIIERERGLEAAQRASATIQEWPIRLVDADRPLAHAAAHFKARFAIAYADAFALALAQAQGAKVVTSDPEFRTTEKEVPVEWLPR